jgi:hypothetical protein
MIFNVKAGGTYSYHYDFKDYEINYFSFNREFSVGIHRFYFSGSQTDFI